MFRTIAIPLGGKSQLRAFVGRDDVYATAADLADALAIQPATVRHDISKDATNALVAKPDLQLWLVSERLLSSTAGQSRFATSAVWIKLVAVRVGPETLAAVESMVTQELEKPWPANKRERSPSLDEVLAYASDNEGDSSSSGSSSSDSSSSGEGASAALPVGVPRWVLTEPSVPEQFSTRDYSKSYALKAYDQPKSLKKELKKMRKWWTSKRNAERKISAVHDNTVDKREERVLCFLGFMQRYNCLGDEENFPLTVALYLNHRLMEAYLEYLQQVREASDSTIGEALTSAISACRWLYRKDKSATTPDVIRRYMDYRNAHQAKAARAREQKDVDELQAQHKWIEWDAFTTLVATLRRDWDESEDEPTADSAQTLHDLLLLGLYSCIPARGAEVRLLQYVPEEMVKAQLFGKQTVKQYVDKQKINLLTRVDGVWKMFISQYKNYRARGVDVTPLSSFPWWTALFEQYHSSYRPLLVDAKQRHDFVFVTRAGKEFTANYFSDFISNLMFQHTGQRVATNLLRSSFVTHFYASDAAQDPAMRESIAAVMRHSVDQALKVYDRRSSSAKKAKGLDLLADTSAAAAHSVPAAAPAAEPRAGDAVTVVSFQRVPHQVIRADAPRDLLLLARMARSATSNAPIYYVPAHAAYEWKPRADCTPMAGTWDGDDFLLQ